MLFDNFSTVTILMAILKSVPRNLNRFWGLNFAKKIFDRGFIHVMAYAWNLYFTQFSIYELSNQILSDHVPLKLEFYRIENSI